MSVNLDKVTEKLDSCKASAAIVTGMFVSLRTLPDSNINEFLCMKMQEIHLHYPIKANGKVVLNIFEKLAVARYARMWKKSSNQTSFSSHLRYASHSSHHATIVSQCL